MTGMPVVDPLQGSLGSDLSRTDDFLVTGSMNTAAENVGIHYNQTQEGHDGGSWMTADKMP